MISKDRIKAFEDKNALLVDMFISQFSTHVVDFFGKDSAKVMPKAKLKKRFRTTWSRRCLLVKIYRRIYD